MGGATHNRTFSLSDETVGQLKVLVAQGVAPTLSGVVAALVQREARRLARAERGERLAAEYAAAMNDPAYRRSIAEVMADYRSLDREADALEAAGS